MRRILGIISALLLTVGFSAVAAAQAAEDVKPLPDRILGNPDAPVTLIEYSSLTCTHCAEFQRETLPTIKEKYIDTGKVKLIYRDFPLDRYALRASLMARCAADERFFPLVDVIFKQMPVWARAADPEKALAQLGKLAGLTQEKIDSCWADKELTDRLLAIRTDGEKRYSINATPTFVVNEGGQVIHGAEDYSEFVKAFDAVMPK